MRVGHDPAEVTLLWALRSPCDLGCRYCYFGTIEEHRNRPAIEPGQLSHLSRDDLSAAHVLAFARSLAGSAVRRVFLAGGEPLIWPPILDLISVLTDAGVQVVVCTNGIALNRPGITDALVALGVAAVSVSLDSTDPVYNDTWRPSRNGKNGWQQVITGMASLLAARDGRRRPRVGIYSVITRQNLADIVAVPQMAAEIGCDYAVPQPISLPGDHPLHPELSLTSDHIPELRERFAMLRSAGLPLWIPAGSYPAQVASAVGSPTGLVHGCFGGRTLFFIEPDGSIWDCPSSLRIAATPADRRRSIVGADAAELFAPDAAACGDCALFSVDCVNMWPLMDFNHVITEASHT